MTALVFLAIVTVGAVAAAADMWHRRRHPHMRTLNYHDDRREWVRFGKAIDRESRS